MNIRKAAIIMVCIYVSSGLQAMEIAGVNLEDKIQLTPDGPVLVLNGAGIREKFFFNIYVAGLYLPKKSNLAAEILAMPGAKRATMHFLHDEVSKEKLVAAWIDGFENNQSQAEMNKLRGRLDRFNGFFRTVHRGDVIVLDYIPDIGTSVNVKGVKKGVIPGDDFSRALLSVWLGNEPADSDLKYGLLGE